MIRTYTELIEIPDYMDRYRYLKLDGTVGLETFGSDRWFNQRFYSSNEWKNLRREIMIRDNGCDLAHHDKPIYEHERIYIHHMNPIVLDDIRDHSEFLLNPEYLICCTFDTHNAIHYGDEKLVIEPTFVIRKPNDMCPWR